MFQRIPQEQCLTGVYVFHVSLNSPCKLPLPPTFPGEGEAGPRAEKSKSLKSISWPEMDDDAAPSSLVQKILRCASKWQLKMVELQGLLESLEKPDKSINQSLCLQAAALCFFPRGHLEHASKDSCQVRSPSGDIVDCVRCHIGHQCFRHNQWF